MVEDDEEEGPGVEINAGIESGVGERLKVAHEDLVVSVRRSKRLSAVSFKCASRAFMSIQALQRTGRATGGFSGFNGPSRVSRLRSWVVRVRHEVAGVSVMHARKHAITCCSASSLLPGPAS